MLLKAILMSIAVGVTTLKVAHHAPDQSNQLDTQEACGSKKCGTIVGIPCPKGCTCIYPPLCADCEGVCR